MTEVSFCSCVHLPFCTSCTVSEFGFQFVQHVQKPEIQKVFFRAARIDPDVPC